MARLPKDQSSLTPLIPKGFMQATFFIAIISLLLGSLATPIIYVMIGYVDPKGFHDLRGADISTISLAFGTAWLFSALITVVVGGILWKPLHVYSYDGAITYLIIAVLVYISFSAINGADVWFYGVCMSAANAFVVRMVERKINGVRLEWHLLNKKLF